MDLHYQALNMHVTDMDDGRYLSINYKDIDAGSEPLVEKVIYQVQYRLAAGLGSVDCGDTHCMIDAALIVALAIHKQEQHCEHSADPRCMVRHEIVNDQEVLPLRLAH